MVTPTLRQLLRNVVPKHVLETRWEHYFFGSRGQLMQFGTFSSREEAQALLDAHGDSGRYSINQEQWAAERSKTFFAHDYPVLHWLGELVAEGQRLVDLGGSVGVTYYLLRDRMVFPLDFEWQVSELTEVVDIGRRLQAKIAAPQLSFTDDWRAMDGASIVLSAGALQFFPKTLTDMLTQLHDGPDHVIINRIPITDDMDTFFTLQNTGESITPMRVEASSRFLADIRRFGFEVVDQWKCLENSLDVPFHPECTLRYFRGFYLRRAGQTSSGAGLQSALSIRPPQCREGKQMTTDQLEAAQQALMAQVCDNAEGTANAEYDANIEMARIQGLLATMDCSDIDPCLYEVFGHAFKAETGNFPHAFITQPDVVAYLEQLKAKGLS